MAENQSWSQSRTDFASTLQPWSKQRVAQEQFSFYRFEKQVKSAVKQCFSTVETRVVFSTNELLFAINKDVDLNCLFYKKAT